MARKARVYYEGALYHVIARGNNREFIFSETDIKRLYIEKVAKYIEKYRAKLYAYVIMDNHAHLLIEVSDEPLSKVMQLIQQTFTQSYNKMKKRTGHVFEQRYKAIVCDKDEYLLSLIKYIHRNPIRAGIADIDYEWSSHKEYVNYEPENCSIRFPLSMLSTDKKKAVEMYMEFVADDDTIEGDETYKIMPEEIALKKAMSRNKEDENSIVNIEELIATTEATHQIKFEMLKGRSKNREITRIKDEFVKKVVKLKLINQKQLSELLEVSEQTISRIVNKV